LIQATPGLELTHVVTANPERQAQARRPAAQERCLPEHHERRYAGALPLCIDAQQEVGPDAGGLAHADG